jgi:hypothetical protein
MRELKYCVNLPVIKAKNSGNMDTRNNNPENNNNYKHQGQDQIPANTNYGKYQQPPKKKPPVVLIILVILLALGSGYLGWLYYTQVEESEMVQEVLENQKNQLTNELNNMVVEYENLKTTSDSMNMKLEAQQDKIKRLLSINASNVQKIQLYQKELKTLREVMKSYIVQIDSLNQRNLQLTAENLEVRTKLKEAETTTQELETQKSELTSKVTLASVLSAKDIKAVGLNKRSKERDKVKRIEKLRVCFTIRENAIVQPGPRDVFLRVIRPDGVTLTSTEENLFKAGDEMLVFSAKREVMYENEDVDMCIYWDNNGQLIEGTYTVELYADDNLIGTTMMVLE